MTKSQIKALLKRWSAATTTFKCP